MGPRLWATIGNIFKIYGFFGFLTGLFLGYAALQADQRGDPEKLAVLIGTLAGVDLLLAVLFWNIKGPLIRGNLIARVLFGGQVLLSIIFSFGINLIPFGIVYLFTGEPSAYDYYPMFGGKAKEPAPRFKAPRNWHRTAEVGPSGATFYSDANGGDAAGVLDSFTPVQVTERRDGLAHIVAATGERGWIDLRVLSEAG